MASFTLHPAAGSITLTGSSSTLTGSFSLTMSTGTIRLRGVAPTLTMVRTSGTGNQLYIGSSLFNWKESTFRTTKTLSGNWSASFDLDFYGGYTPGDLVGQEVSLFWASTKRFGGYVQSVEEEGVQGNPAGSTLPHSVLHVKVGGYGLLTDRVIYAKLVTTSLGTVTGEMVYNFWYEKLAQFGISKVGDAPSTATDEQLFHYITGTEVMNRIRDLDPGYDWWIDDNKLLHYESTDPSGGPTAPFTIRNGDKNSDFMRVTTSDVRFRNREYVLPSADLEALRDDSHTGDGTTTAFSTDYPLNSTPIVRVAGVAQVVTTEGDWVTGWQVYYIPGGVGVFFASAPAAAAAVDILYPNPFPIATISENPTSIAAHGLYEAVYQPKNVFDLPTAQQMGDGFVELFGASFPVELENEYNSFSQPLWLQPGDIVDVIHTFPTASGNFTVEQIDSQEIGLTVWKHVVKMRSGLGEVSDSQALEQGRIAARVAIDSPPYRLNWSLFEDINGLTNPGAVTGAIKQTQAVQCAGVVTSWEILFADNPPTGADFQMDILVNGVSILPSGAANKVVAGAGVTTLQQGIHFLTDNVSVTAGDIVTLNVIQVGSTYPGANATFHLNVKVPANPALS